MATTGNLDNKPVLVSEMRKYVGDISAHARVGNTLKATKTGAMVSVDDAYAGALLKLTAYGNSIQNGTPTPDAPVEIKSVAGGIIKTSGVNLWGGEAIAAHFHGSDLGEDADGKYVKHVSSSASKRQFIIGGLKPNTQYTAIIRYRAIGTGSGSANLAFFYEDGGNTAVTDTAALDGVITKVVVSTAGKTVKSFGGYYGSGTTCIYYDGCCLLEGVHTAEDFVPYVGTATPLTLVDSDGNAHELRSLPDGTRDELVINADGSGTLKAYCHKLDVRSVYRVVSNQNGNQRVEVQINSAVVGNADIPQLSNGFKYSKTAYNFGTHGYFVVGTSTISLIFASGTFADKEAAEAWLEQNPTSVVYALATPATYHIPAVNMPALPDLVSNCWLSATDASGAAIPCEVGIEYRRDINKVIEDIETAIADIVSA